MPKSRAHVPRHSFAGCVTSTPIEGGPITQFDLVICCHCEQRVMFSSVSTTHKEWCGRCGAYQCNQRWCVERERQRANAGCVNWRKKWDNMNAGLPDFHDPAKVSVPGGVLLCVAPSALSGTGSDSS